MGPQAGSETMRAIALYRKTHPTVIIKEPCETGSRMWELSVPSSATMAFDDPSMMLSVLLKIELRDG